MADHKADQPALVCQVFYDEEVVWLRAGGGHAHYLGTDGRVHMVRVWRSRGRVAANQNAA